MGQDSRLWAVLAVLVAVVILALGWFLAISPTLSATSDTRDSIQAEQDRQVVLQQTLASLREQYADIDTYRGQLAAASVQVPSVADTANFRRTLDARAEAAGVAIVSISTGIAVQAAPATATEPADTESAEEETTEEDDTDDSASEDASASDEAATATTTVTTPSGATLVGIPMDITIVGPYDGARKFIASMQETEGRLIVVGEVAVTAQTDSPGSGGRPDTKEGDVEVMLSGSLMVLPGTVVSATPDGDSTDESEPEVTLPSSESNPFAP